MKKLLMTTAILAARIAPASAGAAVPPKRTFL
jgi:hypothetical protein